MKIFNLLSRFRFRRKLEQLIRESVSEGKPLKIMGDLVFKAMLTEDTEDSREALRSLLSACTRREIVDFTVTNSEINPAHLGSKAVRLDVKVTFNDGEIADLEMQIEKTGDSLKDRAVYYASMLLAGQSERGKQYKEIKRVYQVFFLDDVIFPQSNKLPRRYRLMEVEEHDVLTEVLEIIFYELPKLEQQVQDYFSGKMGIKSLSKEEKWCIYLRYRHIEAAEPLINELCHKEEGIMHAEKSYEKVSRSFLKYHRNMDIKKNEYERAVMKETARKEGHAEGHAEGRIAEKLETARKMKKAGRPLSEIEEFTGLSLKEIQNL